LHSYYMNKFWKMSIMVQNGRNRTQTLLKKYFGFSVGHLNLLVIMLHYPFPKLQLTYDITLVRHPKKIQTNHPPQDQIHSSWFTSFILCLFIFPSFKATIFFPPFLNQRSQSNHPEDIYSSLNILVNIWLSTKKISILCKTEFHFSWI